MTTISLRLEDGMKKELDEMCADIGISLTTFFMVYAKKALRERKIPFMLEAPVDPFFSSANMMYLAKSEKEIQEGKVVSKSIEELEAMENE